MVIYKIKNTINNKVYIGQTILPLNVRWNVHKTDSRNSDYPLYRAMRKYGKENFSIEVIAICNSIEELNEQEIRHIQILNTLVPTGYNCTPGGNRPTMTELTRKKMSQAKKGKPAWNKGLKTGKRLTTQDRTATFKSVKRISKYGEIKIYNSLIETKMDGFNPCQVCLCCKKLAKTHRKFMWEYNQT